MHRQENVFVLLRNELYFGIKFRGGTEFDPVLMSIKQLIGLIVKEIMETGYESLRIQELLFSV